MSGTLLGPPARTASRSPLSHWSDQVLASAPLTTAPLAAQQQQARQTLARLMPPCRTQEPWRFTDLAPIAAIAPHLLVGGADQALPAPVAGVHRLRIDGATPTGMALPQGVTLLADAEAAAAAAALAPLGVVQAGDSWPALFTQACAPRLLAFRVQGAAAAPLELVSHCGSAGGVLPVRLLFLLEAGAELDLLQVHRAMGASLTSVQLDLVLGEGARLRHGLLAQGTATASLLVTIHARQAPGSELCFTHVSGGWGLARIEPVLHQSQGAALTRLRGLQVAGEGSCADTHSRVSFAGPAGSLDQVHRAVVDGSGHSVFNGAVVVPASAQRTQAAQISRNLLLSERGRVDTKPELEIVADDVRCTHGATVSRLQENELFYLQSRGIGADQAAGLLLRGFCQDVIDGLPAAAAAWTPLDALLPRGRQR